MTRCPDLFLGAGGGTEFLQGGFGKCGLDFSAIGSGITRMLNHEDGDQSVLGIDPEMRCGQGRIRRQRGPATAFGRRPTETEEQTYCTQEAVDVQKLHGMATDRGWIDPMFAAFGDGNFNREGCIMEDNTWWKARRGAACHEGE